MNKFNLRRKFAISGACLLLVAATASGFAFANNTEPASQVKVFSTKVSENAKVQPANPTGQNITPAVASAQNATVAATPAAAPAQKTTSLTSSNASNPAPHTSAPAPTPAPKLTSFETTITRNGQVAPGTMIYYSGAKGEKGYYGGDLLISRPSITISRSVYSDPYFTVTVPDGQTSGAPTTPWNDTNKSTYPVFDASPSIGTSWQMRIMLGYGAANGTYTVHLTNSRAGQTADGWYYHGFMTVTVVD